MEPPDPGYIWDRIMIESERRGFAVISVHLLREIREQINGKAMERLYEENKRQRKSAADAYRRLGPSARVATTYGTVRVVHRVKGTS